MQPVDGLGSGPAQLVAPVGEHAHHHQVLVHLHPDQTGAAQRDHGHRVRVDRVGLAAVAGGEHPHLRGQFRRHIHHDLPVVHQPVREVFADAVAALDRPDPVGILPPAGEHLGVAGPVRAEPAHGQYPGAFVDDLDRGRTLVWVHPDDHAHPAPPFAEPMSCQQGGHRYFEQNKPLSSLSSRGARRDRRPCESHTNDTGGQPQCGSVSPST